MRYLGAGLRSASLAIAAMRREAARVGAGLRWPVVAERYLKVIHDLLAHRMAA